MDTIQEVQKEPAGYDTTIAFDAESSEPVVVGVYQDGVDLRTDAELVAQEPSDLN